MGDNARPVLSWKISNHNLNTRLGGYCVAANDLLVVITSTSSEPESAWEENYGNDETGRNQNHINPRIP